MICHQDLTSRDLQRLVKLGKIKLAGNSQLNIYGHLRNCYSGKQMKPQNRVFFKDENEAVSAGFRPCGNCMRQAYHLWKQANAD